MFREGSFNPNESKPQESRPKNFYELLGVSPRATQEEISRAFKRFAVRHHPDKGGDTEAFQVVSEAYTTLSDSEERAAYDAKLEASWRSEQSSRPSYATPRNPSGARQNSGIKDPITDVYRTAAEMNQYMNDIIGDVFRGPSPVDQGKNRTTSPKTSPPPTPRSGTTPPGTPPIKK